MVERKEWKIGGDLTKGREEWWWTTKMVVRAGGGRKILERAEARGRGDERFSYPGEGRDVEDREGCERPWDGNAAKGGRVNELLAWRRRHFANTNGHLVMGTWVRGAARGVVGR